MKSIEHLINAVESGDNPNQLLENILSESNVFLPWYKPNIHDFYPGQDIVINDTHGDFTIKAKVKGIHGNEIQVDSKGTLLTLTPDEIRIYKKDKKLGVGDMVRVISINKSGHIVSKSGNNWTVKFVNGDKKDFPGSDLETNE